MKNTFMEEWRDVIGYEGLYQVSNCGRVRNKKGEIRKLKKHRDGYMIVNLSKNGKKLFFMVHRLVAQAFIPNPNNLPCINHKDEDKQSNIVENLEWCDYTYNAKYGTRIKRIINKNNKSILQIDKDTKKIIKEWVSATEVSKELGFNRKDISACCNKQRPTCRGFIWRFKKGDC